MILHFLHFKLLFTEIGFLRDKIFVLYTIFNLVFSTIVWNVISYVYVSTNIDVD